MGYRFTAESNEAFDAWLASTEYVEDVDVDLSQPVDPEDDSDYDD